MYTTIGDIKLYYEQEGSGPDLLLLHGLGSSTEDWEYQIPVFAKHFRVTTLDARGHGRSDRTHGPYSIAGMAWDVMRFLEQHSMRKVHVVGLSMGGMIALHLALDHPERVGSMVLNNTCAGIWDVSSIFKLRKNIRKHLMPRLSMEAIAKIIGNLLFPDPDQAHWKQQVMERWVKNDREVYLACMKAVMEHDVRSRLSAVRVPTLVITADNDLTLPIEFSWELHRGIKGSEYAVVPLSRHATPIDQADKFNETVLDFYRRKLGIGKE